MAQQAQSQMSNTDTRGNAARDRLRKKLDSKKK